MSNHHLCFTCVDAIQVETEGKDVIYVSYNCKHGIDEKDDKIHTVVVKTPLTNHVTECSKYKKASPLERVRRKLFWWSSPKTTLNL